MIEMNMSFDSAMEESFVTARTSLQHPSSHDPHHTDASSSHYQNGNDVMDGGADSLLSFGDNMPQKNGKIEQDKDLDEEMAGKHCDLPFRQGIHTKVLPLL